MGFFSRRHFLKSGPVLGASTLLFPKLEFNGFDFQEPYSLIKPKRLEKGNKIAVTAPGGVIRDPKDIVRFKQKLINMGYNVVLGETLTKKNGYLAGTDEERATELMSFFADKTIDGIIAMRGGWGCARLLDKIDYSTIQVNPKVIMGFSDITSLLNAIYLKTGLVTFHGLVGVNTWNQFSTSVFDNVVCKGESCSMPSDPLTKKNFFTINSGKARGKLIGGNLSVISGIVGSSYFDVPNNSILFLEETNEEPYVVDRLLTHLKLANIYDKVNGVVFGQCSNCNPESPAESKPTIKVISEHFSALKIPVSYGSPFGHVESKWTLPIGVEVEMDADTGSLVMLENAVK